jgi:hypothetical protein
MSFSIISGSLSAIALSICLASAGPCRADNPHGQAGRVAYQYVGRVALNFMTGTGVVYGYLTHLDGLPATASLFKGTPSEATAFFTFRANIKFQPLPGNGDLGGGLFAVNPSMVIPGDFNVYFTADPNHNWSSPDTFSNGRLIAGFARAGELFSIIGPINAPTSIVSNAASATLTSSNSFVFNGRQFDGEDILPRGVTNVTNGPNIALPGNMPPPPVFAFAGYALANQ